MIEVTGMDVGEPAEAQMGVFFESSTRYGHVGEVGLGGRREAAKNRGTRGPVRVIELNRGIFWSEGDHRRARGRRQSRRRWNRLDGLGHC